MLLSRKNLIIPAMSAVLLLMGNVSLLRSQAVSIASVTGRVTDPSGAVLSGARVTMTAVDTNVTHEAVSDSGGNYNFPSLPIGPYTMTVTAPGFQKYVQTGLRLQVNDALQINVGMKVGEVSQSVQVQADATMVQTQQNGISQVVDQKRIVELPLNGRNPTQLITISGAAVNHSDGTNISNKSFYTSESIAIAGNAGNTTN